MDASDPMGQTPSDAGEAVRLFHCTADEAHKFWSIQVRDAVHG